MNQIVTSFMLLNNPSLGSSGFRTNTKWHIWYSNWGPWRGCLQCYQSSAPALAAVAQCLDYSYFGRFVPRTIRTIGGLFVPL